MWSKTELQLEITEHELAAAKAELELELEGELTAAFATRYLQQLFSAIGKVGSLSEFVKEGETLHFKVAHDVYGPLIFGCGQFMSEYFSSVGINGNVYYALRDAAPLLKAAKLVMPKYDLIPVGIYINRPLCGIGDEINPEVVPNGDMTLMIQKYLAQNGVFANGKVGWADAGCWGTVPLVLKVHHLADREYYPIFFYSHNPKIPDYLHWLSKGTEVGEEVLNSMNDSLECLFPSPVRRPLLLTEEHGLVTPKLKASSLLSQKWGLAALAGIEQYAKEKSATGVSFSEQQEALKNFLQSIEQSKQDIWSGVLWQSTPLWSQGEDFLAKFPSGLFGGNS